MPIVAGSSTAPSGSATEWPRSDTDPPSGSTVPDVLYVVFVGHSTRSTSVVDVASEGATSSAPSS